MGSNTTRLLVADVTVSDDGTTTHKQIERRTTITRLAESVDKRGILLPQAIARTRNALIEYRQIARNSDAVFVLLCATSATRDSDNGEAFLGEIEHDFGFRTMLLAGDAEARTSWRGVTSDPVLAKRASSGTGWLIDIGGGSTEIVLTEGGKPVDRDSLQLGSVRLTEQELEGEDPPTEAMLAAARARALNLIADRFPDPGPIDVPLGVAGTVTTAVAITLDMKTYDPSRVHGFSLTRPHVEAALAKCASVPVDERRELAGLEPDRAPVILGGLTVLVAAYEHFGLEAITVSESDILDGIALMAGEIAIDEHIVELPEAFGRTSC
jgi:exopolyphosphatase/guanosine-5'-triphosphate,3'-diphosphate pyrophosphatase